MWQRTPYGVITSRGAVDVSAGGRGLEFGLQDGGEDVNVSVSIFKKYIKIFAMHGVFFFERVDFDRVFIHASFQHCFNIYI